MENEGLMDLNLNVQIEGQTSAQMVEKETSSDKSKLEGSEKLNSKQGAYFQVLTEIKIVNIEIS